MNINKDKIKLLAEQEKEIDTLVDKIEKSFQTVLNLYSVLTYNISGKYYNVYCNRIFNYQDILTFDKLKIKTKDSNGNLLNDGDTVTVIKDLKIKGSSSVVKVGTKVKNIRLIDGDHDIDCKIDGIGAMQLKSEFVKKA